VTGVAPLRAAEVMARVGARVHEVLAVERERWSALDPALAAPLAALDDFVSSGGKRLRPLFCTWGYVAAGGAADDPQVVDAGAAFELLHAFALVHDDVMDGSRTRRRGPTVHTRFEQDHDERGWNGESRRFGEGVAILVGDLAQVYAERLMVGAPPEAVAVWHELQVEINVGQYLDVIGTAQGGVPLDDARRIARYKSGKYTIERPLHVGAALTGRFDELRGPLSAYGDPLGEAFQLRDDLLGAFGDPDVTGKPVGDDLREGKPTPLLAVGRERAVDERDRVLLDRVGAVVLDSDEVRAVQEVLVRVGAVAAVDAVIADLHATAVRAAETGPFAAEVIDGLVALADEVVGRSS